MALPVRSLSLSAIALSVSLGSLAGAQSRQFHSKPLITHRVENGDRVRLHGNVRPEATAANDLGVVSDSMPVRGMQIVLRRSDEQQAAADGLIRAQADPASPVYHHWLSNAEVAAQFGANPEDVAQVKSWLEGQGFTVTGTSLAEGVVQFDRTAGLVRIAFGTSLHSLMVNGQAHFANFSNPELPAALIAAVKGVASLHNFMPRPMLKPHAKAGATRAVANGISTDGYDYLSAGDVAKIYNFNPLFQSGVSGKGQTVVVIEDTNLYSANDWQVFRKTFGLQRAYPFGSLKQINPAGTNVCDNPGANGDDGEAAIDVEWATAAAPNAAIVNAACDDTVQFGGFLALSNLLQLPEPPKIVSVSYGESEPYLGETENVYIKNLYQTAALEGVSLFVSSGDEGAVSSDANRANATHGITVSGFMSTPYNVSVGGTDFGYVPLKTPGNYFSNTNSPFFVTAQSYISEIPWNDSCAGGILNSYVGTPVTGPNSFCNTYSSLHLTASGSGGPSGCATGAATIRGVVSGTCQGYAKPSWQKGVFGNPNDSVRDTPDVSLMASNGFWGSYYAVCWTDTANGGGTCGPDPGTWDGFGGTSVSSPIWAGIQALINQKTGTAWGNPNPVLYSLGNGQYGTTGKPSCNSSLGNKVGADCVFQDVTEGDIAVNCTGTHNCYNSGGAYGVVSTSNTSYQPAYPATAGWDFATGLGTANAANVVNGFAGYATAASKPVTQ